MNERTTRIIEQWFKGETYASIGSEYGITKQAIHDIVRRHTTPAQRKQRAESRHRTNREREMEWQRQYQRKRYWASKSK